jgi:hypothetical protein
VRRLFELACAWGGVVFAVLFGIGFIAIAHFVPPLRPSDTAVQTAALFRNDTGAIRTGLLVAYLGCPFMLAFGASISGQTRRIEGVPAALIHLQVAAYAAGIVFIAAPFMIWWVAAFRPAETAPETIQMLNDFGWISFLVAWVPFVTWFMAAGAAILCDSSATPVYPRWAGYLGLFMGLAQASASFLIYFKIGPFAWNGIFSWWLPATDFFAWFLIMTVLTVNAINKSHRAPAGRDRGLSPASRAALVESLERREISKDSES